MNRVNDKKEFFNVAIEEIARIVREHHAGEVTVTLAAEASDYRKTVAILAEERQQGVRLPIKAAAAVEVEASGPAYAGAPASP